MRHRCLRLATAVVFKLLLSRQTVTGFSSPSAASTIPAPTATMKGTIDTINKDANDNELENNVIIAIQNVASSAPNITQNPRHFFSTLGTFGKSSGALIGQKWLTPASLEQCTLFWDDGFRVLMRDLFRSYLFSRKPTRYSAQDWVALGWFVLLASRSSLIFFPLLLPLIAVALEDLGGENAISESVYRPPSFGPDRLSAMRRLRRPKEQQQSLNNDGTPQNLQEAFSFFKDGTLLLARDVNRNQLTAREDDTWGSYGWFTLLVFSSFPITPLVIPIIDKRRNGENDRTSDYIPSSYRPERLNALARSRDIKAIKFGTTPIDTLRAVTNTQKEDRPPPQMILEAILKAQKISGKQSASFLDALAGLPGRQWELAYVAGKPAVVAMRKQLRNHKSAIDSEENSGVSSSDSWYRPLERAMLPWTRLRDGLYIDSNVVSAIQNFDVETMQNKNGVFQIFNSDFFQTTVEGPFSWDGDCQISNDSHGKKKNAAICAFRPTRTTFQLGPWNIDQDIPEDKPFDQMHIRDLPFFKFIHVDDKVAVAVGRSGSVALWTRMAEE